MLIGESFEVVNIYRNYEPSLSFTLVLYKKALLYIRVDRSQSEEISRGLVYIGDFVMITKQTTDGVKISLTVGEHSPDAVESTSLLLIDSVEKARILTDTRTINFLPFLCDILPYAEPEVAEVKAIPLPKKRGVVAKYLIDGHEVSELKHPIPSSFVVRVCDKTRISMYPNTYNPFFFIIASSNGLFIKIVFWREMLKKYSNLRVGDAIHVKEFKNKKKLPFIGKVECNTFTESVYFDCQEITAKDIAKVSMENDASQDDSSIVLGNADNAGLFETVRGRIEYLSVLMRYNCNSCLMEYVLCRVGDCPVVLFYGSDNSFYNLKEGDMIDIQCLRKIERAGSLMFISTIYTQLVLQESSQEAAAGSAKRVCMEASIVYGAVGYIPDTFGSTAEILAYNCIEKVRGQDVFVNLFMKPSITTVEEIMKARLVINELRKHTVHARLVSINSKGSVVEYTENGEAKKQVATQVVLEGGLTCNVFNNFFLGNAARPSVDIAWLAGRIGEKLFFVVDALLVSIDTVMYTLTGVMES